MIAKILRELELEIENIFNVTDCTINSSKFGIHGNHYNKWLDNFITNSLIYSMPMFSHLLPFK